MLKPTAPKFGVRQVSAANHSIVLMWDGTAWAWGINTLGQLADDTNVGANPIHSAGQTSRRIYPQRYRIG